MAKVAQYRVFIIDADGVIQLADEESHRRYFSTLRVTFQNLRLFYQIGHLLDSTPEASRVVDFKAWVIVTPKAIIASSKNLTFNVRPDFWSYYLNQAH